MNARPINWIVASRSLTTVASGSGVKNPPKRSNSGGGARAAVGMPLDDLSVDPRFICGCSRHEGWISLALMGLVLLESSKASSSAVRVRQRALQIAA